MTGLPYFLPTLLPGAESTYDVTSSATGGAAGDLHALTSHCASAQDLILTQYAESAHLKALLCSYLHPLQELDTAAATAFEHALSIETGRGVHLDLLGRIVREARDGRTDDDYRRAIRVRILVNRSQGRIEDLIRIASLFEDGSPISIQELAPARVIVTIGAPAVNPTAALHARLRRAKAAGVALQTVTNPTAPSTSRMFRLSHNALDATNTTIGLSYSDVPRGGHLSHVVG